MNRKQSNERRRERERTLGLDEITRLEGAMDSSILKEERDIYVPHSLTKTAIPSQSRRRSTILSLWIPGTRAIF